MEDLSILKKQERQLRASIKGVANFVRDSKPELQESQIEVRLSLLESVIKKFYLVRQKIEVLLDAADSEGEKEDAKESEGARKRRLQRQIEEREAKFEEETLQFEEQYFTVKAALLALRPRNVEVLSASGSAERADIISRVKLPDIKLPVFDGKLRDWIPFRDMFDSLIHNNHQLSDIDKFTYLRSAISGEVLQEISSIELSADNYQVACDMLEKRYEKKKLIVKAYLDPLFGIEPLKKESGEALNRLVSDFDRNIQMLGKIGEDTEKWSTILAYMVCARLDSVTLRQWESHHNSKDVPTYQKVMDFMRDQALVLQSITPNRTEDIESRRYRTTVHTTSRIQNNCVFCGNSFHPASTCSKFRAMSVPQRFGVVKMKRLCINCLGSGHFIDRCSRGPCQATNLMWRLCISIAPGRRRRKLLHYQGDDVSSSQMVMYMMIIIQHPRCPNGSSPAKIILSDSLLRQNSG
ncbi:uncharacterized protein LOC129742611 [Uranotaenia lowii]|uniref:uncharacterized protein LOC129742611 n=1 Tax=Uranotaenia lowii TaxID=190385 RepID=UPI002479C381|nr:uncharacterized protein LOC129742611 [Uranotaenia lowii]